MDQRITSSKSVIISYEHNCILLMAIWMRGDTVMKSWGPLSGHSSTTIMFQHDNARPHVLEAENVPVLPWPEYSPDMSPIEHVWDALDRHVGQRVPIPPYSPDMSPVEHVCDALDQRVRQRVPVPAKIQQLHRAILEEWDNIPQATINSLVNYMPKRCGALHEANGGHTRYWLVFWSTPLPFF